MFGTHLIYSLVCLLHMYQGWRGSINTQGLKNKKSYICTFENPYLAATLKKQHLPLSQEYLHTTMLGYKIVRVVFGILFSLHAKGLSFPFCMDHNISDWWNMSIQEWFVLNATLPKINKLCVHLQFQSTTHDDKFPPIRAQKK